MTVNNFEVINFIKKDGKTNHKIYLNGENDDQVLQLSLEDPIKLSVVGGIAYYAVMDTDKTFIIPFNAVKFIRIIHGEFN